MKPTSGPPKAKKSFKFRLWHFVLGAIFAAYFHYAQQKPMPAPQIKGLSDKDAKIPAKVDFSGPDEFVAGECTRFTAAARDGTGSDLKRAGFYIKMKTPDYFPATLFSGANCTADDNPTLEIKALSEGSQADFYAVITKVGQVSFEAIDFSQQKIPVSQNYFPKVLPNKKRLRITLVELPTLIAELKPFSVSATVTDYFDNNIDQLQDKIQLFLNTDGSAPKKLLLGETQLSKNKIAFSNIFIEDLEAENVFIELKIGENSVVSPPIKKEHFTPRNIIARIEGMPEQRGKLLTPTTIEVVGKTFKLEIEGGGMKVKVKNQEYWVDVIDNVRVNLRKKRP